jgi:hypothetical protein
MSGPTTVKDGTPVDKDPSDAAVFIFDWGSDALADDDRHLASTALISSATFTITAIEPPGNTALTKDSETVLGDQKRTRLRLLGGLLDAVYRVDNTIVTNENPAQTIQRSFFVRIKDG